MPNPNGGQPGHSKFPDLVRFYCKNCRLDTTITVPQLRTCPRCHCGISLDELYPGQVKLGTTYISPLTLKVPGNYKDGVNQHPDKRNSGFNPNPINPTQ